MKIMLSAAVAAFAVQAAVAGDDLVNRWNLADLYADPAAWNADAARLDAQLAQLKPCAGQLGESVQRFRSCMDLMSDIDKRYARLATYSSENLDDDTSKAESLGLDQKAQVLGTRLNEAESFFAPEVLALGPKKIDGFLSADPALKVYRHPLDDILRGAPHTLDAAGESIVATLGLAADTPQSTYQILATADLPWPTVKLASEKRPVRLDQAAYTKYRAVPDRADRKKVFDTFFGKWKEYEHTFGVTLYSRLKTSTAYAKVRRYPDSLAAALDANKVPPEVYDTLLAQTNASLPTLHRYLKLRARMLGVKDLHYYDLYPPLVKSKLEFPIEKGRELMLAAVKPLGEDYAAVIAQGLDSRWMDTFPRPHKLSGAHESGDAYDVHPFLLINYTDDYESVSTITHEWGHAMHSWLANHAQPYATASYPIFVAEIASTTNEALLLDHVLKNAANDDEKLYYLGSALEILRTTYFRQAMFADFERQVHAKVDAGEALTGEDFTKIYLDILRRYHGQQEGVTTVDEVDGLEWAYIPHFYEPFYVYQYATSIAAASLFSQRILDGVPGAREQYLKLLKAGGSDYPYELVRAAGVDLATPAPYQAMAARMDKIMDQIEAILAARETARKPAHKPAAKH